jgi:hypothetical protein
MSAAGRAGRRCPYSSPTLSNSPLAPHRRTSRTGSGWPADRKGTHRHHHRRRPCPRPGTCPRRRHSQHTFPACKRLRYSTHQSSRSNDNTPYGPMRHNGVNRRKAGNTGENHMGAMGEKKSGSGYDLIRASRRGGRGVCLSSSGPCRKSFPGKDLRSRLTFVTRHTTKMSGILCRVLS